MEGDALQVVNVVKASGQNWCKYGKLVDSWQIGHVRGDVNYAAHGLTITAVKQIIDHVWMKEILCCICDFFFIRATYALSFRD